MRLETLRRRRGWPGAILASIASIALPFVAAAEPMKVGDDPQVRDAFALWAEWVEYQASLARVPGVSLGLVSDQEVVGTRAFGYANPVEQVPALADTIYSICSISKLFTAVGVMQQRDAGRLRLDDRVADHLDWFDIDDRHPDGETITVRGLLTHAAGLPRESDFPYWTDPDFPFPTREQIRARLGGQETLYPASRYFQYSNLGLALAGELIVSASGQPYDDYIRARILGPLGMTSTYTDIPVQLHGGRLAIGHTTLQRDGTRPAVAPFQARGIAPSAGFASTVNDLAKFAMWQFRVLNAEADPVLRPASLREMHRVQWVDPDWNTTWGLGFGIAREGGRTFVRHSGGCPGYFSEFRLDPRDRIGAIVLTNAIGAEVRFYAAKAFDLVGPAIIVARSRPEPAPERDAGLDRYTGIYGSIWYETAVTHWQGGLALLQLDSRDPAAELVRLKQVGEHTFRRIRADDGTLGEEIYFEIGPEGTATRYRRHSIWQDRRR
jgi:CubicO group peptidase (beta-lactamase class C family)